MNRERDGAREPSLLAPAICSYPRTPLYWPPRKVYLCMHGLQAGQRQGGFCIRLISHRPRYECYTNRCSRSRSTSTSASASPAHAVACHLQFYTCRPYLDEPALQLSHFLIPCLIWRSTPPPWSSASPLPLRLLRRGDGDAKAPGDAKARRRSD